MLWGGTSGGITGIHEWLFAETPSGVHVERSGSFAGEPVEADVTSLQAMLDASLVAWLGHLKAAAESAHRQGRRVETPTADGRGRRQLGIRSSGWSRVVRGGR